MWTILHGLTGPAISFNDEFICVLVNVLSLRHVVADALFQMAVLLLLLVNGLKLVLHGLNLLLVLLGDLESLYCKICHFLDLWDDKLLPGLHSCIFKDLLYFLVDF